MQRNISKTLLNAIAAEECIQLRERYIDLLLTKKGHIKFIPEDECD